jgi:predicted Ser/Thr protein kinase
MEAHVAECDACCAKIQSFPDDTLVARLKPNDATRLFTPAPRAGETDIPREFYDHPRYRVQKLLGRGGMGVVFLAEHRMMERPVALKIIHRELLALPGAVERFRMEAKAAGRLHHPNIVTAFDADQAGEQHFLVMEYVEGMSLARFVEKKGPLPLERACAFVRQAAVGLQHAFEQGMVHRDLKPHNLMLTRKGQVKILDFGLARLADKVGETFPAMPAASPGITEIGTAMGTPGYMAPEQWKDARSADIRVDVFSLGCTLFFLLTGTNYESGSSEFPEPAKAILEKTLAKDPNDRFQTPAEFAKALAAVGKETEPPASPLKRPNWRAAGVVLLVVLAALGIVRFWPSSTPKQAALARIKPVLFVVPDRFDAASFAGVKAGLRPETPIKIVSTDRGLKPTPEAANGVGELVADIVLTQDPLHADDGSAVVLIGGLIYKLKETKYPYREALESLITAGMKQGKPVAALDTSMRLPAYFGLLRDRKCAYYAPIDKGLHGAVWTGNAVEYDGGLLTAGSNDSAIELGRRLQRLLDEQQK